MLLCAAVSFAAVSIRGDGGFDTRVTGLDDRRRALREPLASNLSIDLYQLVRHRPGNLGQLDCLIAGAIHRSPLQARRGVAHAAGWFMRDTS